MFYISIIVKAKTNKNKRTAVSIVGHIKRGVRLAVIPHDKNGYRPHLIRGYGLVAVVCIVIGLQFGYNSAMTGNVLGRESNITIDSLLDQTNQARAEVGQLPLKLDNKLVKAAYLKAQDMFDKQYWAHVSPDGTQPWKWFGDVGYNYDMAGENLAKNFTTTDSVMTAWMNSPEHKANILENSYQDVGFAVMDGDLNGKPTSLVVALYGLSADSAIAGVQKTVNEANPVTTVNILAQFAFAAQSITPAAVGGLILVAISVFAAALAHIYRRKLPKKLRQSWHRHHGLYKIAGLMSFGLVIIFMYGGGQI